MKVYDSKGLCDRINENLEKLRFHYNKYGSYQTVAISNFDPIIFPNSAGGIVAGGSEAWINAKHINGGVHEPGLIATPISIAEDDVYNVNSIFDIGSLYGYFSLISGSIFNGAEVHAFEVNPKSYEALKNNIHANEQLISGKFFAHHCALSDSTEMKAELHVHNFKVESAAAKNVKGGSAKPVYEINVWSLDDFCKMKSIQPNLIKLDVEGYQEKIIPGAMDIISKVRPVILLEFDGLNSVNTFGATNKKVIKPLIDMGYNLIWGNHRNQNARFKVMPWNELNNSHEVNSLGILLP